MARFKKIFRGIKYSSDHYISDMNVASVTDDSRKVKKGALFIASPGYEKDGRLFINDAINRGAAVVVSEKDFDALKTIKKVLVKNARAAIPIIADNFFGHPSGRLKMVGVTGTNGKTTITYLIESILKAARKSSGVIGTINYRIKGREVPAANTTPGALELQALLATTLKIGAGYAVMEVSSHALDQGRVERVEFDAAIFTNLTNEHLDYHKTTADYFRAKTKLFGKLKKGGTAILNNDDSMVSALKKRLKCKVLTYGIERDADLMALDVKLLLGSSAFTIKTPKGGIDIATSLIGMHNISNILAAVAAALVLRIPLSAIRKGIESFRRVPGRLEAIDSGQPFNVFVDYAHTEDALHNVLSLLKDVAGNGNIITVFGCGGDRDRLKRPLMGNVACSFSNKVIVTSDNPRFEDPMAIISEIESGIRKRFSNYRIVQDRREAIESALKGASKGDVVLIAGKGHEKHQLIKGRALPFDDCEVARSILKDICV